MNIREAILKAADHIERNPEDFRFTQPAVPDQCGTPGCALGWIGYFLGEPEGLIWSYTHLDVSEHWLQLGHSTIGAEIFYNRMSALENGLLWNTWSVNAHRCAETLRKYADKYHPAPADVIPASVREIFAEVTNV